MPDVKTANRPAATAGKAEVLQVKGLQAWYGESHILHGQNLRGCLLGGGFGHFQISHDRPPDRLP